MSPKPWNERDFDECCYAVSGVGAGTMVCARPCRGSYCNIHREELLADFTDRPTRHVNAQRTRRETRLEAAKARVRELVRQPILAGPAIAEINATVAAKHGLSVAAMKICGPSRKYSIPRHEAAYELRKAGLSYPRIAKAVGLKDHTSAMHAVRRHEERMAAL